jgi:hypothetical protein
MGAANATNAEINKSKSGEAQNAFKNVFAGNAEIRIASQCKFKRNVTVRFFEL